MTASNSVSSTGFFFACSAALCEHERARASEILRQGCLVGLSPDDPKCTRGVCTLLLTVPARAIFASCVETYGCIASLGQAGASTHLGSEPLAGRALSCPLDSSRPLHSESLVEGVCVCRVSQRAECTWPKAADECARREQRGERHADECAADCSDALRSHARALVMADGLQCGLLLDGFSGRSSARDRSRVRRALPSPRSKIRALSPSGRASALDSIRATAHASLARTRLSE